jgi:hypothetical protein
MPAASIWPPNSQLIGTRSPGRLSTPERRHLVMSTQKHCLDQRSLAVSAPRRPLLLNPLCDACARASAQLPAGSPSLC